MQKKLLTTYLIILAVLLAMMSLSHPSTDGIRGKAASFSAPIWENVLAIRAFVLHPFTPSPFSQLSLDEEKQRLQLENHLLQTELSAMQKELNEQRLLAVQLPLQSGDQGAVQRKQEMLRYRVQALPARVIFRSFDTWQQTLWVNVGESSNVTFNSPVVVGTALVGIIDYVGKEQARVRLITDNRLTPSVRVARGGEHDFLLNVQVEHLLQQLVHFKQDPLSPDDQERLKQLLNQLKQGLQPFKKTWYLAKGELSGSTSSSRNGHPIVLKGTGFNYDFSDEEGESRDLRSGKSSLHPNEPAISILKVNDILITTGMDGVFPPGFQVAIVSKIALLKEGDYYYDLEAIPIAWPLEELSLVFILPPVR